MSAPLQPNAIEAPPPQRGLTREERGRDVSDAQAEVEAQTSNWKLWPARAYQKNHPEEYAANRAKYKNEKWYET
jgi:hypothetical protein